MKSNRARFIILALALRTRLSTLTLLPLKLSHLVYLSALMFAASRAVIAAAGDYDLILRGGTVYDGSGAKPLVADVALKGDRIAAMGDLSRARALARDRP